MNSKSFWNRATSLLLAVVMMVNMVPVEAFAAEWNNTVLEAKRGEKVLFSQLVDEIVSDKSTNVKVTVTENVNGTNVSATVDKTTDKNVAFFVGDIGSDKADGVSFATGGDYALIKGIGTSAGKMNADAQAGYDRLKVEAETADSETNAAHNAVNSAKADVLTAQAGLVLPELSKNNAQKKYDEALSDLADAEKAHSDAIAALDNTADAIALKKQELADQQAALVTKEQNLATEKANFDSWKAENGIASMADLQQKIDAKQAEYDAAGWRDKISIGLELTALKALKSACQKYEENIANRQREVDAQQAEIEKKQQELDAMNEEEVKALLQQDIDNAKAVVDAANVEVASKKAELDNAVVEYNTAAAAVTAAQEAQSAAEAVLAQKEAAEADKWQKVADYVSALTPDMVEFSADDVSYTAGTEFYTFSVKVYDILKITVVDEMGSMAALPEIAVNKESIGENTYKVFENHTAEITVPDVVKYRYTVEGATADNSKFIAGPFNADGEVVVTYTEIGASSVTFTDCAGAHITVNDGVSDITSGSNVKAGTELTVTVTPDKGFTVTEVVVKDKYDNTVALTDGKFTTSVTEENAYTISAQAVFTGSVVTTGDLGSYVEGVEITVDGEKYTAGDVISAGGSTVTVKPVTKAGFVIDEMAVITVAGEDTAVVTFADGTFTFTVKSGCKYEISFSDENIEDIRNSVVVVPVTGATVTVKTDKASLTVPGSKGEVLAEIVPGTKVTVSIKPDEANTFVSEYSVTADNAVAVENVKTEKGVVTFEFTAGTLTQYTISAQIDAPVLAAGEQTAVLNKYDVNKMHSGDASALQSMREDLWKAFTSKAGISLDDVDFRYKAGEVDLGDWLGVVDIWLPITVEEITVDSITKTICESINVSESIVKGLLNLIGADNLLANVKGFAEEDAVVVKATYNGNTYEKCEAVATVSVQDLRISTELVVKTPLEGFVYGNFTVEQVLAAAIAEGGLFAEGERLDDTYQSMLTITMEETNAGERTAVIKFPGDFDYKNTSAEIIVNVKKADATVTMTQNNIILYENLHLISKDYLIDIRPDVQFEDNVGHISFILGVDLNLNTTRTPEFFATIDFSQLETVTIGGYEIPASKTAIDLLISVLDPEGDGLSISELIKNLGNIGSLLPESGEGQLDSEAITSALSELIDQLIEFTQGANVYIKLANDPQAVVPDSHGAYLVGAVTTDSNYNTAVGLTYIIVTVDPVKVEFDGEERQFVYDGTPKGLTATAYDEFGNVIDGTMTIVYAGVQTDGTAYIKADAPVHAGAYTATAIFTDDGVKHAGLAIDTMAIWPSDAVEVDVLLDTEDQYVRTYTGTAFDVKEMISLSPVNTDAKLAIITAGIADEGDFSEDGWAAVNNVINIDFPARADEIFKERFPSAYANGITKSELISKVNEIKTWVEGYGIDVQMVDQIVSVLDQLPQGTTVTFKEQAEVNPVDIGAYVIAAVVFDPDYIPAMDAGLLLILPEFSEETLVWNYNDSNGIFTQPVLSTVDMGASATVNQENTAKIRYTYIGIDKDGKVSVVNTDTAGLAETSASLANGVWVETAYLMLEASKEIYYAQPIVRTLTIVPQMANVVFPSEKVEFVYTGSPIEIPVSVEKFDETEFKPEYLTVRYTGIDSTGAKYDSVQPPVNVGVYTATAVYKEYDGALSYIGMNIATMIITPAQAVVSVEDKAFTCDENCLCDCVEYGEIVCDKETDCVCHKMTVSEREMITVSQDELVITLTQDKEGNVNVLLPQEWNVDTMTVTTEEAISAILSVYADKVLYTADFAEKLQQVFAEIDVETVTVNGEENYPCGEHTVWAVAFSANHMSAYDKGVFTSVCEDPYSGTFGENITWYLDREGVLHIIGEGAMDNSVVNGDEKNVPWNRVKDKIEKLDIDQDITSIADFAFSGCTNLTDAELPDAITDIGVDAFKGCTGLDHLEMPQALESIGEGAYSGCTGLEYIQIYENVSCIGDNAFDDVNKDIPVYVHYNPYAVETLKAMGFTNIIEVDYDAAEIVLDREYLMAEIGVTSTIVATPTYPVEIEWYVEGDSVEVTGDGYFGNFKAVAKGTSYVVASAKFGNRTVYARCRIDVTDGMPVDSISAAHLTEKTVKSNIYSTNYAQINVRFDIAQNMSIMSVMDEVEVNNDNGLSVQDAWFADEKVSSLFDLRVKDDRTLEIIPKMDVKDSKVVKSVKSSYKAKVTVVVNGQEITTVEKLTLKTDKKLPSVKAKSVKLNSFFTEDSKPLVFTGKNINVLSVEVDESKATSKKPAIPTWLTLNDDMTVSIKPELTGKASGKLYLKAMVEGYTVPVKVTVSVYAASTSPKLKLSQTKAVFNVERDKTTATNITLLSSDKKVPYSAIGVTDVQVADVALMTSKNAKTYAASSKYVVKEFNLETGAFVLDVKENEIASSGKVLLEVSIAGSQKKVTLPVTVTAYSKAPSFKLSKTSTTLYTHYSQAKDAVTLKVTPTPADYMIGAENFSWVITDSKNNVLENNVLNVSYAANNVTVQTNENTTAGKYKVVFSLEGAAKTVTLSVTVKAPTLKLSSSAITLNKTFNDSKVITLKPSPADYTFTDENLTCYITDSKGNALADNLLTIARDGNNVKVSVNENTAYGATYKVNFKLAETGKVTSLTVKTLAETKSVAKVSLSVKGKLQTGYLAKGVTITPKWTNLVGGADISGNIKVYATAKAKGSLPVDVTDKFVISVNTNGSYTLKYKDLDSVYTLNPNDKYTIVSEGVVVNEQNVANSKAVKVTVSVTKAKVVQSTKSAKLYLNDRFSRGEFRLSLKDKTLPAIAKAELVSSKTANYYQLVDLGDNEYAIEYKDNIIANKIKSGTVKVKIYLEGNNPEFNKPNATISVKVSNTKFKAK